MFPLIVFIFYLEQVQKFYYFDQWDHIVREWFILFVSVPFFMLNVNKYLILTIHAVMLIGQKKSA